MEKNDKYIDGYADGYDAACSQISKFIEGQGRAVGAKIREVAEEMYQSGYGDAFVKLWNEWVAKDYQD